MDTSDSKLKFRFLLCVARKCHALLIDLFTTNGIPPRRNNVRSVISHAGAFIIITVAETQCVVDYQPSTIAINRLLDHWN